MQQKNNLPQDQSTTKKRKTIEEQRVEQEIGSPTIDELEASYRELLAALEFHKNNASSLDDLCEYRRCLINNRRLMGEKHFAQFPVQALAYYKTALEHFDELSKPVASLKTNNNNNNTSNQVTILTPGDWEGCVDTHSKIFAIYNNNQEPEVLSQVLQDLEKSIAFYNIQLSNQPTALVHEGLRHCLAEYKKISDKIKNIDLPPPASFLDLAQQDNNNSKLKNLLYNFEYTQFILDKIKSLENDSVLSIKCNDEKQVRDISQWLAKLETLLPFVKLIFRIEKDANSLEIIDAASIYQLKQWASMTDQISRALELKDWNGIFEAIVKAKGGSGIHTLFIKKRLELFENYDYLLSSKIQPQDKEDYEHVISTHRNRLNSQLAYAESRRKKPTESNVNDSLILPLQNNLVVSTNSSSEFVSHEVSSNTPNISKHTLVPTFFNSNCNNNPINIDHTHQLPRQTLRSTDNSLSDLSHAAASIEATENERPSINNNNSSNIQVISSLHFSRQKELEEKSTQELISYRRDRVAKLHEVLLLNTNNDLREIRSIEDELGCPHTETGDLPNTTSLEVMKEKNRYFEKMKQKIKAELKNKCQIEMAETIKIFNSIKVIANEMGLPANSIPRIKNISELAYLPALKDEQKRLGSELSKLREQQKTDLIQDILAFKEEMDQIEDISTDYQYLRSPKM
ncbi:MAG: hypothetical protein H0U71_08310 [Gammaproteobacteria bacterium]|nr:hypothetical protein [Gammaproteobacteria bacterium]